MRCSSTTATRKPTTRRRRRRGNAPARRAARRRRWPGSWPASPPGAWISRTRRGRCSRRRGCAGRTTANLRAAAAFWARARTPALYDAAGAEDLARRAPRRSRRTFYGLLARRILGDEPARALGAGRCGTVETLGEADVDALMATEAGQQALRAAAGRCARARRRRSWRSAGGQASGAGTLGDAGRAARAHGHAGRPGRRPRRRRRRAAARGDPLHAAGLRAARRLHHGPSADARHRAGGIEFRRARWSRAPGRGG